MTRWERLGTGMSLVCAVHCAAMPLLIGALPVLGHHGDHAHHAHHGHHVAEGHWLEALIIGIVAVIGYTTLGMSFRRHGKAVPLVLFSLGLGVVLLGHAEVVPVGQTMVAVTGSLILAGAQLLNRRYPANCCGGH